MAEGCSNINGVNSCPAPAAKKQLPAVNLPEFPELPNKPKLSVDDLVQFQVSVQQYLLARAAYDLMQREILRTVRAY